MSSQSNKSQGVAEQVGGKIKATIGKVFGNQRLQAEGEAQRLKGVAREEGARAAERTKGKVEEVAGAVKNRVGAVIDDEELEGEGKVKELEGEARQRANEPKH